MKIVKWIFVSVVALLLAAIASTFFMSENFRVSHTQIIKASPEAVYNQINTLKNWENWSYWKGLDDKMVTTYNDIPSGVGASYSWKSEKKELGSGSLTVTASNQNYYVRSDLLFDGYDKALSEYIIKPTGDGNSQLTSAMNTDTKGIFSKLMARIMMKPMMLKSFKAGAEKMDTYLQEHPMVEAPVLVSDSTQAPI